MSDIATNKKARRDYLISETYECGIVLKGTEVKSIRGGKANMSESYARIDKGELWLCNCDIRPYDHSAGFFQHEATQPRKLLMHRREIDRLFGQVEKKGVTLVPLRLYWKDGKVKVEIGVGKGKTHRDQREDVKKREADREIDREVARFNK